MSNDRLQYCHQLLEQTAVLQDFTGSTMQFDASVLPAILTWRTPSLADNEENFFDWWLPKDLQSALQLSTRTSPKHNRLRGHTEIWIASQSFRHLGIAGGPGTGKTTLARLLARHHAKQFISDQSRMFPVFLDVNGARSEFAVDLDMALQSSGPVLVLIDGLGRVENDWDIVRDLMAGRDPHQIRSIIFAESARETKMFGTETIWSYIHEVKGLGASQTNEFASTESALMSRLNRAVRDKGILNSNDPNRASSLLLELFGSTRVDGSGQATISLMRAIENAALALELSKPEEAFWLRELIDAVTETIEGQRLDASELQALMPDGALGIWLLEPVPGTSRHRFSHTLIKDALVVRALARRENAEIADLLRQLPSGPTRARLTSAIVTYLKSTGEKRRKEPRWRALALTLCQESELMTIGLLVAVHIGLSEALPKSAQSTLTALESSGNDLEKARATATKNKASRSPQEPLGFLTASRASPEVKLVIERTRRALAATPDSGLSDAIERILVNRTVASGVIDQSLVARLVRLPELWSRTFSALDGRVLLSFLEQTAETEAGTDRLFDVDLDACDIDSRKSLAETFGLLLQVGALTALEKLATDPAWQVRRQVALTLGARGSNVGSLLNLRNDEELNVRLAVVTSALLTSEPWATEVIDGVLENGNSSERAIVCYALQDPTPTELEKIRGFVDSEDHELRIAAALALGDPARALQLLGNRRDKRPAALMGPGFHMSHGHVLTEEPGGDLSSTVSWHAMAQLGRLFNAPTPEKESPSKIRQIGDEALNFLLFSSSELVSDSEQAREFARLVRRVIERHPSPKSFSSQVLGALFSLDRESFSVLCVAWSAAMRRVSSREIAALIQFQPTAIHPHIVSAVLLGRFDERGVFSNVLQRHEYVVLRSVRPASAVGGILLAVGTGRLAMGHLTQSAELMTDILSRSDVPLSESELQSATQLTGFVRAPRAVDILDFERPDLQPFALARKLLHADDLLRAAKAEEVVGLLDSVPVLLRNDSWWMLRERCWFSLSQFEEVVKAHEVRRRDVHWATRLMSNSVLAARAANLELHRKSARRFLGVGSGHDYAVVQAQAMTIDGEYSEAARLLRPWTKGDLYASCLAWLVSAGETPLPAMSEDKWRSEELAQLHAEFSHGLYANMATIGRLITMLLDELERRRNPPVSVAKSEPEVDQ